MGFFSFLNPVRNIADDVGSAFTGQPAHGPAVPASQTAPPPASQPIQNPIQAAPKVNVNPLANLNPTPNPSPTPSPTTTTPAGTSQINPGSSMPHDTASLLNNLGQPPSVRNLNTPQDYQSAFTNFSKYNPDDQIHLLSHASAKGLIDPQKATTAIYQINNARNGSVQPQYSNVEKAANFVRQGFINPFVNTALDTGTQLYNNGVAKVANLPQVNLNQTPLSGVADATGATGGVKQDASAAAQVALLLATGGLSGVAEKGTTGVAAIMAPKLATEAINLGRLGLNQAATPVLDNIIKYGAGALTGGAVNAGLAGAATAGDDGTNPADVVRAAGGAFLPGAALGAGGLLLGDAAHGGAKFASNIKLNPDFQQPNVGNPSVRPVEQIDNTGQTKVTQTLPQIAQPQAAELQSAPTRTTEVPSSSNIIPSNIAEMGHALGLSDEQMQAAVQKDIDNSQAITENRKVIDTPAANPQQVDIPEVKPGDYQKARSNAQLASSPVEYAAGQVNAKLNTLSDGDKKLFWHAVEDPSLAEGKAALQEAISRWTDLSNRIHATSQALGGNTGYIERYARHNWDLSDPEDAARYEALFQQSGGKTIDPYDFAGLNRQARVFNTIKEGEQAGFKLKNDDPVSDVNEYAKGSAYALKQQALAKGITEADMNEPEKKNLFDFGNGSALPVSERGMQELKTYARVEKPNVVHSVYRTVNKKAKQTLLSASEFHPINISVLKAGPAEALSGHPVLAAKGVYGTFRSQVGRGYSDRLQQSALKDGTVDAAARIGTPIKYGSDYAEAGKQTLGKQGLGERAIFEKAMPAMHIRMVQGAVKDLEKHNIPLDSPEARQLGDVINKTMGFINTEIKNDNPHVQRVLSDLALAPQFTRAKWSLLKDALNPQSYTKGGQAGKYAASAIIGNTAAVTTISLGLGLLMGQKSDSFKDTVIRNIVHPSVATPFKDSKGNTVELGLPSTYASEALGLGANLKRNKDGHLGIVVKPGNIPGNLANYGRARLAITPSTALKVATNTDYSNKPLYDPNAPAGTKAIQAATTTAQGLLPIGAQGLLQTKAIESKLPGTSQTILNANKPGTNDLVKSVASAFGATPRTDKTTGKGLQTTQYYDALSAATSKLNANDKAAFNVVHPQSKDPVTGQYIVQPTVFDSAEKANTYLAHPNVLAADTKLNQTLASEGQTVDPFFKLTPDQQKAYLQYETINKNNTAQLTVWQQDNPWSSQFQKDRAVFYNSLPPGDPNRPKNPIPYPSESPDVSQLFATYDSMTDPQARSQYFGQHPELAQYMGQMTDYTNKVLQAQGLTPLKPYPKANPDTQSFLNTYMNADPATRKALKASNPNGYTSMEAYMQNVDEYEVARNGALDQLQGQTPNQKLLKGIFGLATYDMVKNPDGTLALKYGSVNPGATTFGSVSAPPQSGAVSAGSSSSFKSYSKAKHIKVRRIYFKNKKPYEMKIGKHTKKNYAKTPMNVSSRISQPKTPKLNLTAPKVNLNKQTNA